MSLRSRLTGIGRALGGEPHADGEAELQVGDPRFDGWEVLRDFGELEAARAWRQYLSERGVDSVLNLANYHLIGSSGNVCDYRRAAGAMPRSCSMTTSAIC
jgi:hypothetical protein